MNAQLEVHMFPCLSDNYGFLIHDSVENLTASIDTPDVSAIEDALNQKGWELTHIINTHHHYDHTGGIQALVELYNCEVYGPKGGHIEGINTSLTEGDVIEISDIEFSIFSTPGHTLDHISYFADIDEPLLFCGDTLFSGGLSLIHISEPTRPY